MLNGASGKPIVDVVNWWAAQAPAFLWAPNSVSNLLRDRARGIVGTLAGTKPLTYGGLVSPAANTATDWIEFPTNIGLGASGGFIGVMLVSVIDPSAMTGAFVKIGNDVDGIGFGAGNTSVETTGSALVALNESHAWYPGSANSCVKGLNAIYFGISDTAVWEISTATGLGVAAGGAYDAPTARLRVNGYVTNRGSNCKVHALALWNGMVANALWQATAVSRLGTAATLLNGMPRALADQHFVPLSRPVFAPSAAAAGSTITTATLPAGVGHMGSGQTRAIQSAGVSYMG